MLPQETEVVEKAPIVFPHVYFTAIDGQEFGMPRERVIHYETYHEKDSEGDKILDHGKTFVNFESPNHKSKGSLHAIIDMPMQVFRDHIMRVAYEGKDD